MLQDSSSIFVLHLATLLAGTVLAHSPITSNTANVQHTPYSNEPTQYDHKDLTLRQATYEFHKWENLWGPNKWCFWWWCKDKTNTYSTSPLVDADTTNNGNADKHSPNSASEQLSGKPKHVRRRIDQDPERTPDLVIPLSITAPSTTVDPSISILTAGPSSATTPLPTSEPAHGGAHYNTTTLTTSSSGTISIVTSTNSGSYPGPSVVSSAAASRNTNILQNTFVCGLVVLGTFAVWM
jgi:hypothetical protein